MRKFSSRGIWLVFPNDIYKPDRVIFEIYESKPAHLRICDYYIQIVVKSQLDGNRSVALLNGANYFEIFEKKLHKGLVIL